MKTCKRGHALKENVYESPNGKRACRKCKYARARWAAMLNRCNNPLHASYKYYGARGIAVCERWHDFENYYADIGDTPTGATLDRIDSNGNYEPGNVRWATPQEQADNRRPHPNGVKTHCLNGHPFDGANLIARSDRKRRCRECSNRATREWRKRHAAREATD